MKRKEKGEKMREENEGKEKEDERKKISNWSVSQDMMNIITIHWKDG